MIRWFRRRRPHTLTGREALARMLFPSRCRARSWTCSTTTTAPASNVCGGSRLTGDSNTQPPTTGL